MGFPISGHLTQHTSRFVNLFILVSIVFLLSSFTACSHKRPFYRSGSSHTTAEISESGVVIQRLILIGDAGEPLLQDPLLESLYQYCIKVPDRTMVVFLGDNVYSYGLEAPENPGREESVRRLQAQIDVVKRSGARGLFIPGNHDWNKGGQAGRETLKRQENMIEAEVPGEDVFLPQNGCPGPVAVDLKGIRLILLDTNHWINDRIEWPEDCPQVGEEAVLSQLSRLLRESGNRQVVVAGHHPLATHGPHGGFYDWQDHIFPLTRLVNWLWLPLPLIGSLYPFSRWYVVKNDQDLIGDNYIHMIREFNQVLQEYQPLVYVAGHDHNLQVLQGESVEYVLVSGAGSIKRITPVGDGANTLFAHSHPGFMVIDVFREGQILLQVVEPPDSKTVFRKYLLPAEGTSSY